MDARTALRNYTRTMIKTYGPNYWENWMEDDRETFNVLVANARKVVAIRLIALNPNTNIIRTIKGHRPAPAIVVPAERAAAWKTHADKHGDGITWTGGLVKRGKVAPKSESGTVRTRSVDAPPVPSEPKRDTAAWFLWNAQYGN